MESQILPESRKTPFYPALDGLRALAVAMVFGVHFLPKIFPYGWLGVQIFFVLSGFLITGILYDTRHDPNRFKNFYARRVLRIFPLYYAVLLILLAVMLVTHGHGPARLWLWFAYLENFWWITTAGPLSDILYTGNQYAFAAIGHLWSLAVEEQFYFLWPLMVFWIRDRRRLIYVCLALIAFRLLLAAYWQAHLDAAVLELGITYRMLPTQCDGFLMGGILALWLRGQPSVRLQHYAGTLAFAAVVFYASLIALLHLKPGWIGHEDVFDYRSAFQAVIGLPLSNLVSVFVILAVIQPEAWVYRICHLRPMRSLGRVSYGLYMFHLPVLVCLSQVLSRIHTHHPWIGRPTLVNAIAATVATVILSYLSFHFYEKRFLRLKNYFTSIKPEPVRYARGSATSQVSEAEPK